MVSEASEATGNGGQASQVWKKHGRTNNLVSQALEKMSMKGKIQLDGYLLLRENI